MATGNYLLMLSDCTCTIAIKNSQSLTVGAGGL